MPTLEFYRARADECLKDAESATLENVRDRLFRSHVAWLQMAERLERVNEQRDATKAPVSAAL